MLQFQKFVRLLFQKIKTFQGNIELDPFFNKTSKNKKCWAACRCCRTQPGDHFLNRLFFLRVCWSRPSGEGSPHIYSLHGPLASDAACLKLEVLDIFHLFCSNVAWSCNGSKDSSHWYQSVPRFCYFAGHQRAHLLERTYLYIEISART